MVDMPQFGTKSLLITVAVVALWLSTFSGFHAGDDVRSSILLVLYLAALLAAIYSRGRDRAFWIGFCAVIPAVYWVPGNATSMGSDFVPKFYWVEEFTVPHGIGNTNNPNDTFGAILDTAKAIWLLVLSTTLGYIGARIHDRFQDNAP
jgi:hypothetical protein